MALKSNLKEQAQDIMCLTIAQAEHKGLILSYDNTESIVHIRGHLEILRYHNLCISATLSREDAMPYNYDCNMLWLEYIDSLRNLTDLIVNATMTEIVVKV